jgi:hypothetical protein
MYGEKFGSDYLRVANAQPGWKEVLDKYNITWVLFDTNSALTAALVEQHDWHPIYSDKTATLFVKNRPLTNNFVSFPELKVIPDTSSADNSVLA